MRIILVSEHRRFHAHLARVAASIPTIEEETESQLLREEENFGVPSSSGSPRSMLIQLI